MKPFSEVKKLTELILNSNHIKLMTDYDGRIRKAFALENESSRFYPVDYLPGKSLTECANLDLVKKVFETMEAVRKEQRPCQILIKFSSKGVLVQLYCDISPVSDQSLQITFIHHRLDRDKNIPPIPDYELIKQSEINLLHQATRLLVEEMKEPCFVLTTAGKIIYANQAFHKLTGYSQQELHEMVITDLVSTEQKEVLVGLVNTPPENQSQSIQVNFITKTGEEVEANTKFLAQFDEFRNLMIIGSFRNDKTETTIINDTIQEQIIRVASKLSLPLLMIEERSLKIIFANAAAHQYYEFDAGDLIHKNLLDRFPASENQHLLELLRAQSADGLESDYTWSQITRNGTEKKSRFFINSLNLENKKIMLILVRDFFQEKIEQTLHEEKDIYHLVDQELLMAQMTPTGMITQVNQAFCEIVGKPSQTIIGKSFEENLFLEDYEGIFQHFSRLSPQSPVRKNRNRIIDANGKTLWIEWTDRGIFEGDQLVEILSIGKDITETYQSELLQKSMELRYQALVENLPMVIYVIHAKSFFPVYISPQVEQLTGYTQEEFYRDPQVWINAMHPEDAHKFYEMLQDRIDKKITGPVEFRMFHKDGHMLWAEEFGSTIELSDGTVLFQGASRDVTERHVTQEKLIYSSNFERLINELSLKLLQASPGNINEILQFIVDELGKIMKVDRSYIFDINHKMGTMSNTFEWSQSGVPAMIEQLQNLNFSDFPWWMEKMDDQQDIILESISGLPPEAAGEKEILTTLGVKSLLVVPLIYDGKTQGFIGFVRVNKETHWEQESINLLRLVSTMIISTMKRFVD